jgi:hypothetical protein
MPIQFTCSCGRKLQAKEEHVGRRVKCPECGAEATVPGPDDAVQTAEPAGARPSPVQKERNRSREDEDEDRPRRRSRGRDDDDEEDDRQRRRSRADDDEEDDRRRSRYDDEDEDRPRRARGTSGKASAALLLGLLGFCLGPLTGIPAIILGLMSLSEIGRSRGRLGGKGMAIAGLLLAVLGTLFSIASTWYAFTRVEDARDRLIVSNNMKQMTLAMHDYNSTYGQLPTAQSIPGVQPASKLSWRVQILPFVEAQNLWVQFHQDEPWDSPHNKPLLTPMPKIFAHPKYPEANAQGLTYYRVFVGENAPFHPERVSRIPADFLDGTSNTILIVEAADPVPWTKPDELQYDRRKAVPKIGGHFRGGTVVVLADGSVRIISPSLSEQTLRSAIDPNDGVPLGPDW